MDAPAFTLSSTHIAVTVKPAHLNYATHTRTDIVLLPISGGSSVYLTPHAHGAISSATFDRSGKRIAWLEMKEDGYESDQNVLHFATTKSGKWDDIKRETAARWEKSPGSISVSALVDIAETVVGRFVSHSGMARSVQDFQVQRDLPRAPVERLGHIRAGPFGPYDSLHRELLYIPRGRILSGY